MLRGSGACSPDFFLLKWSNLAHSECSKYVIINLKFNNFKDSYTPRKLCLWWVYCFHVVRACVRPSVRNILFLNILKSHCWIFINLANMFIYARQILNTKSKDQRPILLELFPFVVLNGSLYRFYVYAIIVHTRADQLLPQL